MRELQQEGGRGTDGIADVAEENQLRSLASPTLSRRHERHSAGPHGAPQRTVSVDAPPPGMSGTHAGAPAQTLGKATNRETHRLNLGPRQRGEGLGVQALPAALAFELVDASLESVADVTAHVVLATLQLANEKICQLMTTGAECLHQLRAQEAELALDAVQAHVPQ